MCEEPRVESMVQPQKRTTTLQKAGKKQGLGLWPHSTLPLAQGLAQVFGNCQQQFSELTPLFSSPFCVQLPSTDHVITELFAYRSIICYSTSPHLNQKIDLTYFIFLVPNKMYGFNSERRQNKKRMREQRKALLCSSTAQTFQVQALRLIKECWTCCSKCQFDVKPMSMYQINVSLPKGLYSRVQSLHLPSPTR